MIAARRRTPWFIWGVGVLVLVGTVTLSGLNGSLAEDPLFIPVAVLMMIGYSTVGALVASRDPGNSIGWLMIGIGLTFAVAGLSDEYTTYTFETNPGVLPAGSFAALVSTVTFPLLFVGLPLIALLFPTGAVPSRRWRPLLPAMIALGGLGVLGILLQPGPLDVGVSVAVRNPLGVEALEDVAHALEAAWLGLIAGVAASIVGLVLRYRRARGEERQQIRWLAYVAGTIGAVIVASIVVGLIVGPSFGESALSNAIFLIVFTLIAIGVPAAIGVALLRYRLYDLDLVVKKTVLYATVAVVLTAVFLAVAFVIGRLAGRSGTGAVVAAGVIGLSLWPAVRLSRRIADRVVYGGRATPYEVLAEFSARVGGSYSADDVLPRMAQILRDAVGALRAIVWLRVSDELRPAAMAPDGDPPARIRLSGERLPDLPSDASVEVRDLGELLGALAVSMPANDPIDPSRERLVRDLAAQAGLLLRNVRLIEELRASRQRLVAAQDEERRRLERDIHDGAQQQLVALSVQLKLAEQVAGRDPEKAQKLLRELQARTSSALEDLRDLAHGIFPPLLADQGLAAALTSQARKAPIPVAVEPDGVGRYPREIESAVYFCVLEALNNVTKYADASSATIRLSVAGGWLRFEVSDDGRGFDPEHIERGSGLRGMADRLEAVGGTLEIRSDPGAGTIVMGSLPQPTR